MNPPDTTLPPLSDERIDEMESVVFARIARERTLESARTDDARRRSARRGRWWMGGAAAAAVIVVAAVIAPQVLSAVRGSAGSAAVAPEVVAGEAGASLADTAGGASTESAADGAREIAVSASATVEVTDAARAAAAIGEAAVAAGGFVETMSIGASAGADPAATTDMYVPFPAGTWITVRVPSDRLTQTLADLDDLGTVTASQIDRRDVTSEAVDLRARVAALETSVTRLTDLLAQSASTADLIAAESALSERQSELDSLRQQLTWVDSQVDLSSAMITLTEPAPAVTADPAGFGDGVAAGWNGLVAALNGLVVALGFLLPWIAVAALAGVVVWAVRRGMRRRSDRDDSPLS